MGKLNDTIIQVCEKLEELEPHLQLTDHETRNTLFDVLAKKWPHIPRETLVEVWEEWYSDWKKNT